MSNEVATGREINGREEFTGAAPGVPLRPASQGRLCRTGLFEFAILTGMLSCNLSKLLVATTSPGSMP